MHISERGLLLIERFEGFRADRYLDAVGVPTIGFGTTGAVISSLPAHCTVAQATGWLRLYVERACEPAVNGLGVPLNQNQFDALCSLVYNCGPGVMGWQIGRDLRARNYAAASADFMNYVFAGGQRLQGLVTRRAEERALFDSRSGLAPADPHHYLWLDGKVRDLGGGHHGSERAVAIEYDRKRRHPRLHRRRLGVLRRDLRHMASRLEDVMRHDAAHNERLRRPWRHAQLLARAEGRRLV